MMNYLLALDQLPSKDTNLPIGSIKMFVIFTSP